MVFVKNVQCVYWSKLLNLCYLSLSVLFVFICVICLYLCYQSLSVLFVFICVICLYLCYLSLFVLFVFICVICLYLCYQSSSVLLSLALLLVFICVISLHLCFYLCYQSSSVLLSLTLLFVFICLETVLSCHLSNGLCPGRKGNSRSRFTRNRNSILLLPWLHPLLRGLLLFDKTGTGCSGIRILSFLLLLLLVGFMSSFFLVEKQTETFSHLRVVPGYWGS